MSPFKTHAWPMLVALGLALGPFAQAQRSAWPYPGAKALSYPDAVAWDAATRTLLVTDQELGQILRLDSARTVTLVAGDDLPDPQEEGSPGPRAT